MRFSARSDFGSDEDALMLAAAKRRRLGGAILDLTVSNPTACGLGLSPELLLIPLANAENCGYHADPAGPLPARKAVCSLYYGPRGVSVDPGAVILTASTSEAYSFLFRLLCEPGDEVLIPQPSYPLFDMLAQLSDVQVRAYSLRFHDRWQIDFSSMEANLTPRTRAIVVVHPNNPTGHVTGVNEQKELERFAKRHGLPLLVDEVFMDYPVEAPPAEVASFARPREPEALTFVMSGLSKVLALPQMKLAWIAVRGPEGLRKEAQRRLEFIADTLLSVGAPPANAAAAWLEHSEIVQEQIKSRVRTNLARLDHDLAEQERDGQGLVSRLPVEAGWSVILRIPALEPDGEFALHLLEKSGVLVHPGSFFGFPGSGWIVLSLLGRPEEFQQGVRALLAAVGSAAMGYIS